MRAAIELGTELGEEGLTMRGIAARLGVSATALYQHFEGKASILQAIRFHGLRLLTREMEPAFAHEDPIDQIRDSAVRYIGFARSNPWLYGLLFEGEEIDFGALDEEQRRLVSFSQVQMRDVFIKGKQSGRLRGDIDAETAPFLMWAANHGLAMLMITGRISEKHPTFPVISEEEFIASFVESEVRSMLPGSA